jgi:molybdenum cofactor synthesis domain-containing protein
MPIHVVVLTVGNRYTVEGAHDELGELMEATCRKMGWELLQRHILGDDQEQVTNYLIQVADSGHVDVIFTLDGIGLQDKDRVPESMMQICEKWVPGLAEMVRVKAHEKSPQVILTRGLAGIRGKTILINLPGSPTSVKDSLDVLKPVLRVAVEQVKGSTE